MGVINLSHNKRWKGRREGKKERERKEGRKNHLPRFQIEFISM